MKFERFDSEIGSEARQFKAEDFYKKDDSNEQESGSILHMVEGMKDEHVNEGHERSADMGTDQSGEGEADIRLRFSEILNTDLDDVKNMEVANRLVEEMNILNPVDAEAMRNDIVEAKAKRLGNFEVEVE